MLMRNGILALVLTAACSGSAGTDIPSVYGTWKSVNAAGVTRGGLTFNRDGTYSQYALQPSSTSLGVADAQVERGTFTLDNGRVRMVPTESSCPEPDPVQNVAYSLNAGHLAFGQIPEIYKPGEATAAYSAVTIGCFDGPVGDFVARAIMPVTMN
jgi:hypothetical protein